MPASVRASIGRIRAGPKSAQYNGNQSIALNEQTQPAEPPRPSLLRSKFFWVAVLYFSEGFPLGVFYELFPVYFRQQGVDLSRIGLLSLLGLAWTLKFLWAPAVDHYRHHRTWMAAVDLAMGAVLLAFAFAAGFGPWVWAAIGIFTLLSATNDIAIDGYTIELLNRDELGLANGIRIGFYRVGMIASGLVLVASDWIGWSGAFGFGAVMFVLIAMACLCAPRERLIATGGGMSLRSELTGVLRNPRAFGGVLAVGLLTLWLVDGVAHWSRNAPAMWPVAWGVVVAAFMASYLGRRRSAEATLPVKEGPMFGALVALLSRPAIVPVLLFILTFKLGDASMGFMIKPFWVDSGFTATEIGLVSVNLGLVLSIAGGLVGGWYADRSGIFRALWVLGLFQALSNLGYAVAASLIPTGAGVIPLAEHRWIMYSASAAESFTGGLGTAAFLAFLMAIVDKRHSAAEYALLSSVFALSRSVAGWAGGFGA
jgi:MFS transporter, PAT family, beta-lactamase induction signal transducer AmpG